MEKFISRYGRDFSEPGLFFFFFQEPQPVGKENTVLPFVPIILVSHLLFLAWLKFVFPLTGSYDSNI